LPIQIIKTINGIMTITLTLVSSESKNVNNDTFKLPKFIKDETLNVIFIPGKEIMKIDRGSEFNGYIIK